MDGREPTTEPSDTLRTKHDMNAHEAVWETVLDLLAEAESTDPSELDIQLAEAIDPDALDRLFRPRYDGTPRAGGYVEFVIEEYEITVDSDGEVQMQSAAAE